MSSLTVWLTLGVLFGLLFAPGLGWFFGLLFGLLFATFAGLIVGLLYGGSTFIQHYTLRWLLYRQGSLPFRDLIPWLDHCCERLFLRRVGGGYIFIHRLLMEHFAAMADEDIARVAGEVEKKRQRNG